jgi:hypothetical protein
MQNALVLSIVAVGLALPRASRAERPAKLTVAMFAPSLGFADAKERSRYLDGLAAAIEAKTGVPTHARVFAHYGDLAASKPDFAVIDATCIAARAPGQVLATAVLDGATTREWGVWASASTTIAAAAGKARLAYAATGCRDGDFVDEVVFGGELKSASWFAGVVTKLDVRGAVVATRDYQEADLVIAPKGLATSLHAIVSAGALPNPGFVQLAKSLDGDLVDEVQAVVLGYAATGIDGWSQATGYAELAHRMTHAAPRLVVAEPDRVTWTPQRMWSPPAAGFPLTDVRKRLWRPARNHKAD